MKKVDYTPKDLGNKICRRCLLEKSLSDFGKNRWRKDGLNHYCKICNGLNSRESEARHPHLRNRAGWSHKRRLSRHGITQKTYDKMLKVQGGKCAICKGDLQKECIDHCHKTGMVRGLLCSDCNLGIGFMKDNVKTLKSAIRYLRKT